jgi:uncharacterized paraquat-inducible protein A
VQHLAHCPRCFTSVIVPDNPSETSAACPACGAAIPILPETHREVGIRSAFGSFIGIRVILRRHSILSAFGSFRVVFLK